METTSDEVFKSDTEEITQNPSSGRRKKFQCSFCRKGLSSKQNLKEHEFTHTGELPYVCKTPGCGLRFRQGSVLSAHKRVHGIIDKYVEQEKYRWVKLTDLIQCSNDTEQEFKHEIFDVVELPPIREVSGSNIEEIIKLGC